MLKEHARFQLEATKLGRTVTFQVTVFEKRERRGSRLFAETQCYDPYNFMIHFIIRDAETFEGVLDRFIAQLLHRGFEPIRYRIRLFDEKTGYQRWGEWLTIEAPADPSDLPES